MIYAHVVDGRVRNRIVWDGEGPSPVAVGDLVPESETAGMPDEEPQITLEQAQARVGALVQAWIDGVCTSGTPYFRDIFSARGYVNDPNPAYHARAVALRDWSSSVWTALDEIQADVMAGNRQLPTLTDLLAELPQPPA